MKDPIPSMLTSFDFEGTWLSESFHQGQCAGKLSFSPDSGYILHLHGLQDQAAAIRSFLAGENETVDICGFLSNGTHVKLYSCRVSGGNQVIARGIAYETKELSSGHHALFALPGEDTDIDSWEQADITLDVLAKWLGLTPFIHGWSNSNEVPHKVFRIDYDHHRSLIPVLDLQDHQLNDANTFHYELEPWSSFTLDYRPALRITPSEPQNEQYYINKALHYRTLITLLSGDHCSVSHFALFASKSDADIPTRKTHSRIIFPQAGLRQDSKRSSHTMPFSLPSLDGLLNGLLKTVIERSEVVFNELWYIIDLFLGSHISDDSYILYKLSAIIQALEGYHRIRYEGLHIDEENYRDLRKSISDYIEDNIIHNKLRGKLIGQLTHGNEYSLRARLREVLDVLGDDMLSAIVEDTNNFISRVCEYRNDIAHALSKSGDSEPKVNSLMIDDYYRLFLILESLIWLELGIPKEMIANGWKRGYNVLVRDLARAGV